MRIDRILVGHAPVRMRRPMRSAIHEATHTYNALVEVHAEGVKGQGAALTLAAGQARAVCEVIGDLAELLMVGTRASSTRSGPSCEAGSP